MDQIYTLPRWMDRIWVPVFDLCSGASVIGRHMKEVASLRLSAVRTGPPSLPAPSKLD